jgi:putative transcriptional regulator
VEHESLTGNLLVASPSLFDPNFRRAVVLVVQHSEDGAIGIVLNRPSDASVDDVAPELVELVTVGDPVYVGGPVDDEAIVILADFVDPAEAAAVVLGDIGFVSGDADFAVVGAATRRARIFIGLAGWAGGQLEAELSGDDWIVIPAEETDVFPEPDEDLWAAVLRRRGGPYELLSRMPLDPSLN